MVVKHRAKARYYFYIHPISPYQGSARFLCYRCVSTVSFYKLCYFFHHELIFIFTHTSFLWGMQLLRSLLGTRCQERGRLLFDGMKADAFPLACTLLATQLRWHAAGRLPRSLQSRLECPLSIRSLSRPLTVGLGLVVS